MGIQGNSQSYLKYFFESVELSLKTSNIDHYNIRFKEIEKILTRRRYCVRTKLSSASAHHFLPSAYAPKNSFFKLCSHIFWFLKGQTIHSFKHFLSLKFKHYKRKEEALRTFSFPHCVLSCSLQWRNDHLLCTQSKKHRDKVDLRAGSAAKLRDL